MKEAYLCENIKSLQKVNLPMFDSKSWYIAKTKFKELIMH